MIRLPHSYTWHKRGGNLIKDDGEWSITYGDMMTLLLCLFVLLLAMSPPIKARDSRSKSVLNSLHGMFGMPATATSQIPQTAAGSLMEQLETSTKDGRVVSPEQDSSPWLSFTHQADGIHITLSGDHVFAMGTAGRVALTEQAVESLKPLAEAIQDINGRVEIQAVVDDEKASDNKANVNAVSDMLAAMKHDFDRVQAVSSVLTQCGLSIDRLQIVGNRQTAAESATAAARTKTRGRVDVVVRLPSELQEMPAASMGPQ